MNFNSYSKRSTLHVLSLVRQRGLGGFPHERLLNPKGQLEPPEQVWKLPALSRGSLTFPQLPSWFKTAAKLRYWIILQINIIFLLGNAKIYLYNASKLIGSIIKNAILGVVTKIETYFFSPTVGFFPSQYRCQKVYIEPTQPSYLCYPISSD